MSETIISFENVTAVRGKQTVLNVDHMELHRGETLAVIGPNGSGKSTLLLVMAFLLKPASGLITFEGETITKSGAPMGLRRRVAVVFQTPLLADTSVERNVAMGLRFRRTDAGEVNAKVNKWMERLGISHLKGRRARELSGGEAQRVSLARAMAIEPDILLLDEPLASLDAPTRIELLDVIENILDESGITAVFVTHDRNEALAVGDRIAVLINGSIAQVGTPDEIFNEPASEAIASFVGVETITHGFVERQFEGLATVHINGVDVEVVSDYTPGTQVVLFLRPEDVVLSLRGSQGPSSMRNNLPGVVTKLQPVGSQYRVETGCGFPIVSLITKRSQEELGLINGSQVVASFKASAVHLIRHREKAGQKASGQAGVSLRQHSE